jgi:predicted ATPase
MLRRLVIRRFKSIEDSTVDLKPLVVIFGPNATGKSNVLESMLLLSRLVTERTLADAFDEPIRGFPAEFFLLPESGLEGLYKQKSTSLLLEADVRPARAKHDLRYKVGVSLEPSTGKLCLDDEYLVRVKRGGEEYAVPGPRIQKQDGEIHLYRLGRAGRARQEPVGGNYTFASDLRLSGTSYPDFDLLRRELSAWQTFYLDPRTAMRRPQPPQEVGSIGVIGETLAAFLHRLKETPKYSKSFAAIQRALSTAIPSIESLDVTLDQTKGLLDIVIRQDGTNYSSRIISEGTLRVLALCSIAASPFEPELVAFEEPENGVHPRRIEVIGDILDSLSQRGSQVVVTTHSPTFVATMLRKKRADPDRVEILLCRRRGRSTVLRAFEPTGELFDDNDIRQSLLSEDEDALIGAMLTRGWFDG